MKDEIKYQINPEELREKSVRYRIEQYEEIRYVNLIKEMKLIEEILEFCKEDTQIASKYKVIWETLNKERKEINQRFLKRESDEERE